MIVRPEQTSDIDVIRTLTETAFRTAPHAAGTEHLIIDRLRAAGALTLSLVAEADGAIAGHVAFSPGSISASARSPSIPQGKAKALAPGSCARGWNG